MQNFDEMSRTLYYRLADLYDITAIYHHGDSLLFRVRPHIDDAAAEAEMKRRLAGTEYEAAVSDDGNGTIITFRERKERKIPWLNIGLFILTLGTMYYIYPGTVNDKLEFVVSLIAILLFHEFGHYFAGRRRGVNMSLPYFIPAPNIVGTFGAIIKSKSPFLNRRDLIEVGAMGPIAGFVVAILVLMYGLQSSPMVQGSMEGAIILGDSLLLKFLSWLIIGPLPAGYDYSLSPAAWAGWVGLLVTMLNLLPIGQLDGGHIIYGLAGRFQHKVAKVFLIFMAILGFNWYGWWFFGVMAFIFGINHPRTLDDEAKLPLHAKIMGYAAIAIFVLSFMPVPIRLMD